MAAPRKFDWDEARRLHEAGLGPTEIRRRLGVSTTAVRYAVFPKERAYAVAFHDRWQRAGVCPDCGAQTTRVRVGGDRRCVECALKERTTSATPTALECARCREWKPDMEFPRDSRRVGRRGRRKWCRSCDTAARREYRRRKHASKVAA